jgi:hypothetical protein
MIKLKPMWLHFKTITKHKYEVFKLCCIAGIPWRGLLHDLSKYSIKEFYPGALNFQGDKSPIDAEKVKYGYSIAWQHHKGHNSHHWEYWTDFSKRTPYAIAMPYKDAIELVCDWIGAGKVYNKTLWSKEEPLKWFLTNSHKYILHPKIFDFLNAIFRLYANEGDKTLKPSNTLMLYRMIVSGI